MAPAGPPPDADVKSARLGEPLRGATRPVGSATPASQHAQQRPVPALYLKPNAINWNIGSGRIPGAVTVRLHRRGGLAGANNSDVGPARSTGKFWRLASVDAVFTGDALYDYVIEPLDAEALPVGGHYESLDFACGGEVSKLPITLRVAGAPSPGPLPRATSRRAVADAPPQAPGWPHASAGGAPPDAVVSSGGGVPARTVSPTRERPYVVHRPVDSQVSPVAAPRARSDSGRAVWDTVRSIGGGLAALAGGLATIAGAAAVIAVVWWVVKHPGGAFGVLLWATPILLLAVAAVAVCAALLDGIGAALGVAVASLVCLVVLWIVYSFVVAVWPGSASNCPSPVPSLPKGPELCAADRSQGGSWGPPLFHFAQ